MQFPYHMLFCLACKKIQSIAAWGIDWDLLDERLQHVLQIGRDWALTKGSDDKFREAANKRRLHRNISPLSLWTSIFNFWRVWFSFGVCIEFILMHFAFLTAYCLPHLGVDIELVRWALHLPPQVELHSLLQSRKHVCAGSTRDRDRWQGFSNGWSIIWSQLHKSDVASCFEDSKYSSSLIWDHLPGYFPINQPFNPCSWPLFLFGA